MNEWTEGQVSSGSVPIHYYRTGEGNLPPLLLAHGFTDNGLCWSRCARALQEDFDIVMVDARNHGRSGAGSASVADLSADLAVVITALQWAPCAVMGHSVGASVATGLASDYPQLVSRLVLEDPPWTARSRRSARRDAAFREQVARTATQTTTEIIAQGQAQHPLWHEDEFAHWARSNQQVRADAMEQLDLGQWQSMVPRIACPTLLLYADGEGDGIVSHEIADQVVAMNQQVRIQHIEQGGHNLRREQFQPFVTAVRQFLLS